MNRPFTGAELGKAVGWFPLVGLFVAGILVGCDALASQYFPRGVTAALVLVVMLAFDLSGIAMMGSAAFLLVYAAVNAGHLRVLRETGANAIIVWLSLITCLVMFVILSIYTYQQQPAAIAALLVIAAGSFAAEWLYRRFTGRVIKDAP